MSALAPPSSDEQTMLLGFLAGQRRAAKLATYGLSDVDATRRPTASGLSVAAVVKHLADMERTWAAIIRHEVRDGDYLESFRVGPDDTVASLISDYDAAALATTAAIEAAGLDAEVPVPQGVPWFPADVAAWSVRWVILHMIEETARHAGHADIVRESVDGATAYPLLAAAEGWPATPWLQPWSPVSAA